MALRGPRVSSGQRSQRAQGPKGKRVGAAPPPKTSEKSVFGMHRGPKRPEAQEPKGPTGPRCQGLRGRTGPRARRAKGPWVAASKSSTTHALNHPYRGSLGSSMKVIKAMGGKAFASHQCPMALGPFGVLGLCAFGPLGPVDPLGPWAQGPPRRPKADFSRGGGEPLRMQGARGRSPPGWGPGGRSPAGGRRVWGGAQPCAAPQESHSIATHRLSHPCRGTRPL